jgi:hypothetical protein
MANRVHYTASKEARKIAQTEKIPQIEPSAKLPEIISSSVEKVVKQKAGPRLTAEQHHGLVEVTAYYLAERRGFEPGHESEDWSAAENLVVDSSGLPVT